MTELRFLNSLLVLDHISAPLSGPSRRRRRQGPLENARAFGPSDGLTLLDDEVLDSARLT
jgi:hypothetical protein